MITEVVPRLAVGAPWPQPVMDPLGVDQAEYPQIARDECWFGDVRQESHGQQRRNESRQRADHSDWCCDEVVKSRDVVYDVVV
ncbi:hypothetical protein [Mycolicibacterium aubagnense]|uniref:hypothetical protein n=1 Tax=Mycolicibacterium aubagnense TaxID=319707 RepID=UPI0013D7D578|nr:hypothetical protein [Mycolicibacterium aubagnense]